MIECRINIDDAECSGRPKPVISDYMKKVHKVVLSDFKLNSREVADTLKISEDSISTIPQENLGMRRLLSKWVPGLLTPNKKRQCINDSKRCLELFKRNKKDVLHQYVTMYEMGIHYYISEPKKWSAEWTAPGESRPKRPKPQKSAGKIMASVFWDAYGILMIDLEKLSVANIRCYHCFD